MTDLADERADERADEQAGVGRGRSRRAEPRRARRIIVLLLGLVVVAGGTAMRAWMLGSTWFWLDDLILVNVATRDGLSLSSFVTPHLGHLMPAGRALAWVVSASGTFDYSVAAVQLAVLYALACLAVLHLLVTLFGARPGILLPLTYVAFSPWLVSASSWWSVGINHLPALAATALALSCHVRYLRGRHTRSLVGSVAWLAAGLLFAELTMLAYVPLVVITAAYFATGSLVARAVHVWERYRASVLAHGGLVLVYAVLYVVSGTATFQGGQSVSLRPYVDNLVLTLFPSVAIGGPRDWQQVWAAQFSVDPSPGLQLAGLGVVVAVFTLTALTRERGLRAWLIPLLQIGASLVLLAEGRAAFGPDFALDVRFTTPVALGVGLALGLAFLPVPGALESSTRRRRSWIVDHWPVPTAALAGFVVLSVSSASAYPLRHVPADTSPRTYYDTLEQSLDDHQQQGDAPIDMVPGTVPGYVIGTPIGAFGTRPESDFQYALRAFDDRLRYPLVVQDDYYTVTPDGVLVHPSLKVTRRMEQPDDTGDTTGDCQGRELDATAVNIPLDGIVYGFVWRARIRYDAEAETPVTIRHGDESTETTFLEGEHTMEFPAGGTFDRLGFSGLDPYARVCVTAIDIGTSTIPGLHPDR